METWQGASAQAGAWLSSLVADETFPGAKHGRCRLSRPDLFYPAGESHDYRPDGPIYELPKAICAECSVMVACRDYAIEAREQWGVWGGTTPRERRAIWEGRQQTG